MTESFPNVARPRAFKVFRPPVVEYYDMGKLKLLTLTMMATVLTESARVSAQPTVINEALPDKHGESVIISFIQPDLSAMSGCHYSVLAAKRRIELKNLPGKGLSIASFTRNEPLVQIIAGPLRRIKRQAKGPLSKRFVPVFVRTEIPCPGAQWGSGETIKIRIPTHKNGKLSSVKDYIRDMKYHMQYYEPE